jgi:hypothetical protein
MVSDTRLDGRVTAMALIAEPMSARDLQVGDRFVTDMGKLWTVAYKEDNGWVWVEWGTVRSTGYSGSAEVWRV